MNEKITTIKWFLAGLVIILSFSRIQGAENDINNLVLYLMENDVIMTQNTEDSSLYEGYDQSSKASYKAIVSKEGKINDLSIEIINTTFEKLDMEKILALKWFTNQYLDKNEDYFNEIKENINTVSHSHSSEVDLGEWKVKVFVFPLNSGAMDISLHFTEDALNASVESKENTLSSMNAIYKELGCIEIKSKKVETEKISYKLPYYKLNPNENIYYNSFINKNQVVYKIQFIYYKNGFDFDYRNIPQTKQIISVITNKKQYPFDKLNIQFKNLKKKLLKNTLEHKISSAWHYEGIKTVMDIERYANRDQCRIKISIFLLKNRKQE